MKLPKFLTLIIIVFAILFSGFGFFLSNTFDTLTLKSWLQGEVCRGFCWQRIDAEITPDGLEDYLISNSIQYVIASRDNHYRWDETQSLASGGLGQTSAIFSEGQIIRMIADMRACVTTILDTYGNPDDIKGEDGHFSIIYFDSELGEGWSFSFREQSLPYAEVSMRIYNDSDFVINMETVTLSDLSNMISEPCDDDFD